MSEATILSLLRQIVRVGRVSTTNVNKNTVTVIFEDRDDSVSGDLQLVGNNPMPRVGEQVLCLYIPSADGFCLGVIKPTGG